MRPERRLEPVKKPGPKQPGWGHPVFVEVWLWASPGSPDRLLEETVRLGGARLHGCSAGYRDRRRISSGGGPGHGGRTRPKMGRLNQGAVVAADDGPGDAGVAVWGRGPASARSDRRAGRPTPRLAPGRGPFEDLLGPVHAHVVVHPAGQTIWRWAAFQRSS